MATPDPREAFLRRLEGGGNNNLETPAPTAPSTEETATANDDMIRFLKEAGLESTPIDPSSLEVLKKMVTPLKTTQQQEEQPRKQAAVAFDLSSSPLPPLQEVQTSENRRLDRMASEITIGTTMGSQAPTNATIGGEEVSSSKLILQQLEMQTQMMMDMQQRIDHLTNMVHQMQGGVPVPPQGWRNNQTAPGMQPRGIRLPPVPVAGAQPPMIPQAPVEAAGAAQPQQPLPPPPRTMFGALCDYVTAIPGRVRESRTAEVWRVFWALHRRYVRLDGGLIFKIMLMVAVFSAKTMSRKNRKEDFWSASLKFQLVMGLVALGFLLQTGYLNFIYRFFFKENYLERIYGGEIIDVEQVNWQEPRAAAAARRGGNNLRNLLPQNNLIVGNIPEQQRRNGFNVVVDIFVLLGSFLLSILPMWKAEGPEARARREAEAQAAAQLAAGQEAQPPPAAQAPQQGPNEVAPPQDLDQFAADDDDDDNDDVPPHAHQD